MDLVYNFDEAVDRHGTCSSKWESGPLMLAAGFVDHFDENTIPLFTADMDFRCPQSVKDAILKLAEQNLYGYTTVAPSICPSYYEAVTNWYRTRQGWSFSPEDMVYVNGTIEAIKAVFQGFSEPGDGVLITRPLYGPFTDNILGTGRTVVNSQLREEDLYYTVDWEDFERKAADPKVKIFALCSPHNPTGRIWTDEELVRMYDICTRNHVLVMSDEVHGDLIRVGKEFHPLASLVDGKNLITFTAVNKTFNLAGLQGTNAVITNPELRARFQKTLGWRMPNPFTIAAMTGAYSGGAEWLDQVRAYIDGNIDWALDFMAERMPQVRCRRPDGTYILWMDFRAYGLSAEEIHRKIYWDANVMLEGGRMFDPDRGDGFERMCVPTRRALLKEAFERIAKQFA